MILQNKYNNSYYKFYKGYYRQCMREWNYNKYGVGMSGLIKRCIQHDC